MARFVIGTTRWFAVVVIVSPTVLAVADESCPTPSETPSAAVETTEAASPAEAAQLEPPVDEAEAAPVDVHSLPRFKHASYPDAWTAAQESNRPILVYVTMPQCPHCNKMIDQTYSQSEVDEMVKGSFETMQAGRYTDATLVSKLHVRWFPTTVLVGPNNKVIDVIEGYVDANTFKRRLQLGIASAKSTTQTLK